MNTKPVFRKQILGVRKAESYRCRVPGCGLDCGDQGTLERHLRRAHAELISGSDKHDDALAVPETSHAVRAMTGIDIDAARSIEKTNRAMGIVKSFLPRTMPRPAREES